MDINFLAVAIAVVLQFALGAVWYSPLLFGKLWMKIHNCDTLSKTEMKKMQQEMGPYYGVQLGATVVTTIILALLMRNLPQYSPFMLAFLLWLGFMVPTQVSAVIFGQDEKKWFVKKITIMAGAAICCLIIASAVLSMFR